MLPTPELWTELTSKLREGLRTPRFVISVNSNRRIFIPDPSQPEVLTCDRPLSSAYWQLRVTQTRDIIAR